MNQSEMVFESQFYSGGYVIFLPISFTGWVGTFDRHRTFAFTDPYGNAETETLFVKKGSSVNWRDLTGLKVGILDGYSSDEHCLARQTDQITVRLSALQPVRQPVPI